MKALSIRQPWTWAILNAGKRIENREWRGCSYRGPILIHAAKGGSMQDWADDFDDVKACAQSTGVELRGPLTIAMLREQSGGIVGRARIDGVIRGEADFAAYAAATPGGEAQRAWWRGGFALVLADVVPVPFVPCRGALGLFDVDERILCAREATP